MKIFVGGEFSGRIRDMFIEHGHEAMSCDKKETEVPGPHYKGDMREVMNSGYWDIGIFHPDCENLCWSGERWFTEGKKDIKLREDAFEFFKLCYNAKIPKVAVENAYSWFLRRNFMRETQLVHPFHFGDPYRKSICLWLRGLKPLIPTNIVWQREAAVHNEWPGPERKKNRSRTYPGIARAMAEQWG